MKYLAIVLACAAYGCSTPSNEEQKQHPWDQAEIRCMEIFNKSFANDTDGLSTCVSKPGLNMNYSLSVDLWKRGVAGGSIIGEGIPSYRGALDAETTFKVGNNNESSRWVKLKDETEANIQTDNQGTLGRMPDCVRVGIANGLLESGKSCGMSISEALNSEKYQLSYESVCLAQTNNASKCKTLATKAYQKYLLKKQTESKK